MYRISLCLALTFAAAICMKAQSRVANAADAVGASTTQTTITLKVLTCENCAKKVAAKLTEVSGVGDVKMDVKSKTATVTPKSSATPSPLQMWEAIEKAGKEPVKLEGPSGTFTSKPKK